MKHKLSELEQRLAVVRRGKGKDAHYIAECPLCPYTHPVDVRTSEKSAEVLATQNVMQHLQAHHAQEIDRAA